MNNSTSSKIDYACTSMVDQSDMHVHISYILFTFLSMVFVLIGCIGNTISMVVFSTKSIRKISSNVYLWVLSLSDTCYLLSALLSNTIATLRCIYFREYSFDIVNRSNVLCKLLQYCMDLFGDYSCLLILAFTVERYVACYHAIWFRNTCTVFKARLLCLITLIVLAIAIAPYHVLYLGVHIVHDVCTVSVGHEKEFIIFYIMEVVMLKIVPVFIIAVLNIFIIIKVRELSRKKACRKSPTNSNRKPSKEDRNIQLTILLLLVSTSYVILYLPVLIHFITWGLHRLGKVAVSRNSLIITQNYTRILYIMGFSINFFLYTLSGKVFRDQLVQVLYCGCCGLFVRKQYLAIAKITTDTSSSCHQNSSSQKFSEKQITGESNLKES